MKIASSMLLGGALCLSLFATTPTNENVTELYVATFKRAPDAAGLAYWVNDSSLDLEGIAQSFFDQPETQTAYPPSFTNEQFIVAIYDNLFNREPDSEGYAYWLDELNSGRVGRSVFILAVINGALNNDYGNDAMILDNKTIAGLSFVTAGFNDIEEAKELMQGITDDAQALEEILEAYGLLGVMGSDSVPPLPPYYDGVRP